MMLCQICKANPATIHIQEIVNGETNTLHICAECAQKRNLAEGNAANSHFHEMLERLTQAIANSADLKLAELFEQKKPQEEESRDIQCGVCGASWHAYRKNGKVGCAACYDQFGQLLLEDIGLNQHGSVHCGKTPPETVEQWQDPTVSERINLRRELERLRKGLDESVRREEFEQAAELRDKIAAIESELKSAELIPDESTPETPPKKPRVRGGRRKSS
jgi:protein arginine kinase activator